MIRSNLYTIGHAVLWCVSAKIEDSTAWHTHDFFEFALCRSAQGHIDIGDQLVNIRPGCTVVIAPGVRHRLRFQSPTADMKFFCMSVQDTRTYLAPYHLAFLEAICSTSMSFADHGSSAARLWDLADQIPASFAFNDKRELGTAWGVVGLLLALHLQSGETPEDYLWQRYQKRIAEIRNWIDIQLHQSISLEEVCATFGMSRSLFTREFRRHTGKSFIDYCNWRRVENAANLLVLNGASVTQAALESGFSNLSHFYRQFKSVYGVTPTDFRRQVVGIEG
ncbi:helix-turn-helix domain-containing protein [Dechloromonas sp. XY25]|uniref:Helix-turn-helix domain-containing protein n=1 Tax=Dechloromonas hankyongensis TaxID=2908002 RepID=A0ABS9K1B5_9RHOO|nr:helix-turn-helix domain-containing protein [Dechloromonas hankyongensis]MCG2576948.1 helix-turn-helix domain-containing protein [Dechloromonas hankyongensis]